MHKWYVAFTSEVRQGGAREVEATSQGFQCCGVSCWLVSWRYRQRHTARRTVNDDE